MEIRPATLAMVQKARNGKYVAIDDDVQGVANGLHRIDNHIRLRYSEAGDYYVVYWTDNPEVAEEDNVQGNTTYLIFTAQDLDQRIVTRMEEVYFRCQQPGYSFSEDLEQRDAEEKKRKDAEYTEQNGELYERLAHGMRKDLGYNQGRMYVPKDI